MAFAGTTKSRSNAKDLGFKCDNCSATFASKRTLNYHTRKLHTDANRVCDICGISLASKTVLSVHKKIHFWEKEENDLKYYKPIYECSVCDLETHSPCSLVLHCMETHPSHEGLFNRTKKSRKKLNSKFTYDENQNKSYCTELKQEVGKQVKCPLCRVSYREDRIKGHFMTAHPFHKRLFCTHCAAIIAGDEEMWSHMLEHSHGNDLYKCEFCECLFISAQTLEKHRRLHTCRRPFCCSVCQKEFQSKTGAIAHFHSHLKIEMLQENGAEEDKSAVTPLTDASLAMFQADDRLRTPVEDGSRIIIEDSEDFVHVWD